MRSRVYAVSISLVAMCAPVAVTAGTASAVASSATVHCRKQTITYTHGHKNALDLNHGKTTRTRSAGAQTITDGYVTATYEPLNNGTPSHYVDIQATYAPDQIFSRLQSVTVYPVKGKKKTFKIVKNPNKDEVYKYELIKSYNQVQLPVSGSTSQGRPTPKLNKLVVKGTEHCYSTPEPSSRQTGMTTRVKAAKTCRAQTITFTASHKNRLSMNKGPSTRTKIEGQQTQDDTRVLATWASNTIGGNRPSYYFKVELDAPTDAKYTRLTTVTVFPKVGKKKTFHTQPGNRYQPNKYQLDYHHTVVIVPVNKNETPGRPNPVENKVVVKAKEGCYSKQQT